MALCSITASAEGSAELNKYGGNRAYTEWDAEYYTAGIERTTKLNLYAKSGVMRSILPQKRAMKSEAKPMASVIYARVHGIMK